MSVQSLRTFLSRSRALCRSQRTTSLRSPVIPKQEPWSRAYTTAGAPSGRTIKVSHAFAAAVLLGSTSYVFGIFAPPPMYELFYPRPAPPPLPAESEEGKKYTERIEKELHELEILKRCKAAPDADDWYETRPYVQLPRERMVNNFTAGALRGPGKIAVPPIVWAKKDETEAWVFFHLGRGVCGHEGIVHGGLLATILDEGCGRNAVLSFPSHLAVTANLNLDYRAPTKADQTRLVEIKGRKAVVEGRIEDLQGNLLVQAKALFIEPKIARALSLGSISGIFPSAGHRVGQLAGTQEGGQVADEGIVKGK